MWAFPHPLLWALLPCIVGCSRKTAGSSDQALRALPCPLLWEPVEQVMNYPLVLLLSFISFFHKRVLKISASLRQPFEHAYLTPILKLKQVNQNVTLLLHPPLDDHSWKKKSHFLFSPAIPSSHQHGNSSQYFADSSSAQQQPWKWSLFKTYSIWYHCSMKQCQPLQDPEFSGFPSLVLNTLSTLKHFCPLRHRRAPWDSSFSRLHMLGHWVLLNIPGIW